MENKSEITEDKIVRDSSVISTELIQSQVDNYRNNQLTIINENMMMEDAHSIWFDMVTLKNFIAEIEREAYIVDPEVQTVDLGIRFYYAAYPEEPEEPISNDYARRHTFIMIPTKKQDDLNYDFNPFETDSETDTQTALALTSKRALAQNHGTLTPPGVTIVESY